MITLRDHKIMLVKDFDPKRWHPKGFVSPKLDGVRAVYYPGERNLISRMGKRIYGMDHIVDALKKQDHVIDMELMVPGVDFNTASGIVRNYDQTPEVHAHMFDVPSHNSAVLMERLSKLPQLSEDFMHAVTHIKVDTLEAVMEAYNNALTAGYEGLMWKKEFHAYVNARTWNWMRLVPVHSEDCEVTGFYEGQGKMAGILGGLYITFRGIKNCKVGTMKGLSYEDRYDIWVNQEKYRGLKAIVEYKELQVSGKPRQPRFKGFRDDK